MSDDIEFAPDLPRVEPEGAVAIPASSVRREKTEWLWPGRVPLGAVTALAGREGLGKSTLTCNLSARLTRGELTGRPEPALLATAEDSLSATLRPRLEAEQADLDLVYFLRMRKEGLDYDLTFPTDFAELHRLVEETGAKLVVIDPLMAHLEGRVDSHRDQSMRSVLAPFHHLAQEHGCAVVVLVHLNKGAGLDAGQRIGGSIAIAAAARSVLLLARDPDDPNGEQGESRVLAHVKSNLGQLAQSLLFEIRPILIPATGTDPDVETSRMVEIGPCDYTGSELLSAGKGTGSRVEEAQDFLREQLGEPRASRQVKEAAEAAGITAKTLRRAREQLGVEEVREGFPATTTWRLPHGRAHAGWAQPSEPADGHSRTEPSLETAVPSRAHVGTAAVVPIGVGGTAVGTAVSEEQLAAALARHPEIDVSGWPEHERRTYAQTLIANEASLNGGAT